MLRRPTAEDRRLADVLRRLQFGQYDLVVDDLSRELHMAYMGLARLKTEGTVEITLPEDKLVVITPRGSRNDL
jgi:hypothetical protein